MPWSEPANTRMPRSVAARNTLRDWRPGAAVLLNPHVSLPLSDATIASRSTENRINLADNVGDVKLTPDFGGYLDVVMHGDATKTQANIDGQPVDFTLDEVVAMVRRDPDWRRRPIRLMSCSTGEADYARKLAEVLQVPVYAPSNILSVKGGMKRVLHGGVWRRFEPSTEPE